MSHTQTIRTVLLSTVMLLAALAGMASCARRGDVDVAGEVSERSSVCGLDADPRSKPQPEALLTDPLAPNHVSLPRPRRLLPTHGTKRHPRGAASGYPSGRHAATSCLLHTATCRRRESVLSWFSAPRDYYVIALRHILR